MKRNAIWLSLLLLCSSPAVSASSHPFGIPDEVDATIRKGLNQLFNLEFDTALATFKEIKEHGTRHPMVSFGIASCHWWRLSVLVLETDHVESRPFLEATKECIRLSRQKIREGDPTGEGHLVYGGILGLWGRWEATNHNYLSAYFKGKKAYRYLKKALVINPELKDAYMGLGIFDYYVATLPAVVRILAFLGMGGDPQVGINELFDASRESRYAKTPSKLFLADILANLEDKPDTSLKILADLRKEYPKSAFIHMLQIIALYNHGDGVELERVVKDFAGQFENGTYDPVFQSQPFFAMGMVHFKRMEWEAAARQFTLAADTNLTLDPFHTWSILYRGYALDALGQRDRAMANYKNVLSRLRRWGSHEHARARRRSPFTPQDEEVRKLKL